MLFPLFFSSLASIFLASFASIAICGLGNNQVTLADLLATEVSTPRPKPELIWFDFVYLFFLAAHWPIASTKYGGYVRSLGSDTLRPVGFVSYYVYKDTCMVLGCLFSSAIIKPSLCSVLLSHYCLQIGVIMKRNLGSESVKETGVPVIFIQTQGSWITVLSCIHPAGPWFALMFGSISQFVPQLNRLVACDRIASLEHPAGAGVFYGNTT